MLERLLEWVREMCEEFEEIELSSGEYLSELDEELSHVFESTSDTIELMQGSLEMMEEIQPCIYETKDRLKELKRMLEMHKVVDPFADEYKDYLNGEGKYAVNHSD